jgi:DNA-binding NarL/FixJ family response regulator
LAIILGKDPDFTVAALAADGREAVAACAAGRIDVALVDARMPMMDGIEAIRRIAAAGTAKAIVLTTFEDEALVRGAVEAGARGYLLKGRSARDIKDAVRLVHSGSAVFQDSVFATLLAPAAPAAAAAPAGGAELTERERELAGLVAEGLSNKEIAGRLYLSEGTVKNYVSALLAKLGLAQRTQIAAWYYRGGA